MPKKIVIHAMGEFIDTENEDYYAVDFIAKMGLSVHAFVTPSGVVIRSRDDREGAYHAKGYNTDTLGVEFLVKGLHTYSTFLDAIKGEYLTTPQYQAGIDLVKGWMEKWNINKSNVVFHSTLSPDRKFDPGEGFVESGFDVVVVV